MRPHGFDSYRPKKLLHTEIKLKNKLFNLFFVGKFFAWTYLQLIQRDPNSASNSYFFITQLNYFNERFFCSFGSQTRTKWLIKTNFFYSCRIFPNQAHPMITKIRKNYVKYFCFVHLSPQWWTLVHICSFLL